MQPDAKFGVVGLILLGPALLLVATSFLGVENGLPGALVHPVLLMGGLLAALGLNAIRVFRIRFGQETDALVGTVSVRFRGTGLNLAALGLGLALLGIMAVYLFGENFQPRVIE